MWAHGLECLHCSSMCKQQKYKMKTTKYFPMLLRVQKNKNKTSCNSLWLLFVVDWEIKKVSSWIWIVPWPFHVQTTKNEMFHLIVACGWLENLKFKISSFVQGGTRSSCTRVVSMLSLKCQKVFTSSKPPSQLKYELVLALGKCWGLTKLILHEILSTYLRIGCHPCFRWSWKWLGELQRVPLTQGYPQIP